MKKISLNLKFISKNLKDTCNISTKNVQITQIDKLKFTWTLTEHGVLGFWGWMLLYCWVTNQNICDKNEELRTKATNMKTQTVKNLSSNLIINQADVSEDGWKSAVD